MLITVHSLENREIQGSKRVFRFFVIVACRDGVRQDPEFRAKFHAMCAHVGVDPLASNKGVWAQLLGFGDFYYELGVQIVEACLATRAYNGGLIDLPALQRYVQASLCLADQWSYFHALPSACLIAE